MNRIGGIHKGLKPRDRIGIRVGTIACGGALQRILEKVCKTRLSCVAICADLWRAFNPKAGRAQKIRLCLRATGVVEFKLARAFKQLCPHCGLLRRAVAPRILKGCYKLINCRLLVATIELILPRQHCENLTIPLAIADIPIGVVKVGIKNINRRNPVEIGHPKAVLDSRKALRDRLGRDAALRDCSICPNARQAGGHCGHGVDIERHRGGAPWLRNAHPNPCEIGVQINIAACRLVTVIWGGIRIAQNRNDVWNRARQGDRKGSIRIERDIGQQQIAQSIIDIHDKTIAGNNRACHELARNHGGHSSQTAQERRAATHGVGNCGCGKSTPTKTGQIARKRCNTPVIIAEERLKRCDISPI